MQKKEVSRVGVASVGVFNPQGQMLWGCRNDTGKWTLPGGHMEPGESPLKAAVRELYEEAGLTPEEMDYLGFRDVTGHDGKAITVHAFKAVCKGNPTSENDPDEECDEWEWFDIVDGELPASITENQHSPKNVVLQLMGMTQFEAVDIAADLSKSLVEEPSTTSTPRKKAPKPLADPNLVVTHNLTASNFMHAHEIGGLPAPSIGVSHMDAPLGGFGEVTLVGHPDLVDPEKGSKTYAADVYSPRWPTVRHKVVQKEANKFSRWLAPHAKDSGAYIANVENDFNEKGAGIAGYDYKYALQLAYLREKGESVELPKKKKRTQHEWVDTPAMHAFFAEHGHNFHAPYGEDYHTALSAASSKGIDEFVNTTIKDIDDEGREDIRGILRSTVLGEEGKLHFNKMDSVLRSHKELGEVQIDKYALNSYLDRRVKELGEPEFEEWAKAKLKPLDGGRYISRRTDYGNERKVPYTLNNILKELTRKVRGGESFNYGLGTARAHATKQFKSLEQIRGHRSLIVPKEEFEKHKAANNQIFDDLVTKLEPHNKFGGGTMTQLAEAVGESYKRGRWLGSELDKSGFKNVPPQLLNEISKFASRLASMPTEYFEAKPPRIVHLHEFQGAVVPHDIEPHILEAVKHHVGHVETYERNNAEQRNAAVKRIAQAKKLLLAEEKQTLDKSEGASLSKMVGHLTFPHFGVHSPKTEPMTLRPDQTNVVDRVNSQAGDPDAPSDETGGLSFASWNKTKNRSLEIGYAIVQPHDSERDDLHGIREHEAQHSVFNWIAQKHGYRTNKELARYLYEGLDTKEQKALHMVAKNGGYGVSDPNFHEEALTTLQTFLVSPKRRRDFFSGVGGGSDETKKRNFHSVMKGAWRKLMDSSKTVRPEDVAPVSGNLLKSEENGDVDRLIASENPVERKLALKLNGVSESHLRTALTDADKGVRLEALEHDKMTPSLLRIPLFDEDSEVVVAALRHGCLGSEHLTDFLTHPDPRIRGIVATRSCLTEQQIRGLVHGDQNSLGIKLEAIKGLSAPDDLLVEVVQRATQTGDDDDIKLAQEAMLHDNFPESILEALAHEPTTPLALRAFALEVAGSKSEGDTDGEP